MTGDRTRALLDSLGAVSSEARGRLAATGAGGTSAVNPLALRFANGARIVDQVTGRRGHVISGLRTATGADEIFEVMLDDASTHYRSKSQLEADRVAR